MAIPIVGYLASVVVRIVLGAIIPLERATSRSLPFNLHLNTVIRLESRIVVCPLWRAQ